MARPLISDAIRIRRAIMDLSDEDLKDLSRDVKTMIEVREHEKAKASKLADKGANDNGGTGSEATS